MRSIDTQERRARLARRHLLGTKATSVEDVAAALAGLHSSDPATVYLSARARSRRFEVTDLEESLYGRRSLVRMLGMRRTLFIVPLDLAAVMDAACTRALAPPERRRLVAMIEDQGLAKDGARWVRRVERGVLTSLESRGQATAVELTEDVPQLSKKLRFGEGKTWGGEVGMSTRILFLLATDGLIVRTRPLGGWTSSQYRWSLVDTWLGGALPRIDPADAKVELLRRWLGAFGPGTLTDIAWWTGWSKRDTTAALRTLGAEEVQVNQATGYVLPDDVEAPRSTSWVALLPSLDPTVMGWKERDWYLGEHAPALFDRNGNAGPTVWADGRVVGGWIQGSDGRVAFRLLERVDSTVEGKVEAEARRLEGWLGDVRVTPRFRTPLEKELSSRT